MNTFKRKALTCAVLAGLGAVATTAEAVYMNPDGTGQVLVFPYYTVNSSTGSANSYNTYISITNTTSQAKVLKVRFREGRASAEVLDFNLYLSPNDVWVGAVAPYTGTGAQVPAALYPDPRELSCTSPVIPSGGEPFKNFDYLSGTGRDLFGQTGLDRTREGYVEVFDMATLLGAYATNVTHTAINTPPPNCSAMRRDLSTDPANAGNVLLTVPTGGLYGEGTIINVLNGASVGYKADALGAYSNVQYYNDVTKITPLLGGQVSPPQSLVLANGNAYFDAWGPGPAGSTASWRALNAVFMHSDVLNDYILDSNTQSNTDWVLTFPAKSEFVSTTTAAPPYTAIVTTNGACENVQFTFFNRDEQSFVPATGGFSPQPTGVGGPGAGTLCWESTVVSVRNGAAWTTINDTGVKDPAQAESGLRSGVLGSRNVTAVTVLSSFEAGWMDVMFTGTNATNGIGSAAGVTFTGATGVAAAAVHTFVGLPVTGFMVTARANKAVACTVNGVAGNCNGNYAGLWNHSYRTVIRP